MRVTKEKVLSNVLIWGVREGLTLSKYHLKPSLALTGVAQLVRPHLEKQKVAGSIPC